jgi:hypothetical protein
MKPNRLEQGVRYIYTHLPRLLASSGADYLRNARGPREG